jgi:hypothetical protein
LRPAQAKSLQDSISTNGGEYLSSQHHEEAQIEIAVQAGLGIKRDPISKNYQCKRGRWSGSSSNALNYLVESPKFQYTKKIK